MYNEPACVAVRRPRENVQQAVGNIRCRRTHGGVRTVGYEKMQFFGL